MQLRTQVALIVGAAVLVWAAYFGITGQTLSLSMLAPLGAAISVVTLGSIFFVNVAWRWRLWRGWLVERPYLGGTWKCTLRSNYLEKKGAVPIEKTVYVVIRQSMTEMSFRLYTDKARSASLTESIARDGTDLFRLAVAYQNTPNVEHRGKDSEIHYGAALFMHIDYGASVVEGHYWTDRNTAGSLTLRERRDKHVSTFEAAEDLFAQ